ncbi:MAG TPA: hypothetical protein VFK05_25365 [Polyangiaceae bacterium]|nr:hypothetical protein [Polyangiaceae bacterium]
MEPVEQKPNACLTCYGQGEVSSDYGAAACPDCGGAGTLPPQNVLVDWRISAIEKHYQGDASQAAQDIAWLAFELRRTRHAFMQVLALAQDAAQDSAAAHRIQFLANDALGVYRPESAD